MIARRRVGISATALGMLCLSTISVDGWSQATPDVAGDPWAIGYAVQVARVCPAWDVEKQETLARRGILAVRQNALGMAQLNEAFSREYNKGFVDAAADQRRLKGFCGRVRTAAGARWPRLARVLRRVDDTSD